MREDVAKPLIINEDDDQELLGGFALEYVLDENKFKNICESIVLARVKNFV